MGFATWIGSGAVHADANEQVASLLRAQSAPPGVVFEVVTGDPAGLRRVIPRIKGWVARLHARFPGLGIAVVSHGMEQFALQSSARDSRGEVHRQVRSLVRDEEVSLHVCGTFADWHGVPPESFPDYVGVSASGPAQLNDYEALGYVRIRL
ncbi:MAG: hypothetical protein GWO39_07190 [Gammaproteobacteria bacterium]|nr:hypothetical protein [Gammaproteobacteria bacterium]NIT63570.1 hypothetical protein [Gammaproteobacteria bacterium]NIY32150.1 hypothetical protein [Gammaproteobacteria bacterium]